MITLSVQATKAASNAELLQNDPYGFGLLFISLLVVFTVLISLFLSFKYFFRFYNRIHIIQRSKKKRELIKPAEQQQLDGEILAAIAMTLHLYKKGFHDEENTILTMKKINKSYSPWNSKFQGLRRKPGN